MSHFHWIIRVFYRKRFASVTLQAMSIFLKAGTLGVHNPIGDDKLEMWKVLRPHKGWDNACRPNSEKYYRYEFI